MYGRSFRDYIIIIIFEYMFCSTKQNICGSALASKDTFAFIFPSKRTCCAGFSDK